MLLHYSEKSPFFSLCTEFRACLWLSVRVVLGQQETLTNESAVLHHPANESQRSRES